MTIMGDASSPDLACVARVLQGDETAAGALVERLRPLVVAVVRRRMPRRSDEADLIQMVFLRVFTKLDQYSGQVPLEHWVSRIALNTCLNELRHERHRPELRRADLTRDQDRILEALKSSDEDLLPDQQLAARDLVQRLLECLPPRENLIISLLYLEGYTLQEIQASTGWSALAVRLLAYRARKRMKKFLRHLLKENPR